MSGGKKKRIVCVCVCVCVCTHTYKCWGLQDFVMFLKVIFAHQGCISLIKKMSKIVKKVKF